MLTTVDNSDNSDDETGAVTTVCLSVTQSLSCCFNNTNEQQESSTSVSAIAPERQLNATTPSEVASPIAADIVATEETLGDDDDDNHESHETRSTADGNEVVDQLLPGDSEDMGTC